MSPRSHLSVGVLVLVSLVGFRAESGTGPRLVCDEPEYSFGEKANTLEVNHEFILRNEGDETLEIFKVKPDCGCTLVKLTDKKIHPGEQAGLIAKLSLKGRKGKQRKRITLDTNDPVKPRLVLYLNGSAIADLEVRPSQLFWGNIREDETAEKTVQILFSKDEAFHVLDVKSPSSLFAVETNVTREGQAYNIRILSKPPLPHGRFKFPVTVKTDHPRRPVITIPMQGRVVGEIFTIPDEIILEPGITSPVSMFLIVRSSSKKSFQVLQVEPPVSNVQVNVNPVRKPTLTRGIKPRVLEKRNNPVTSHGAFSNGVRSTVFSGYRIQLKDIIPSPDMDGQNVKIVTDCETMKELFIPIRILSVSNGE